MSEPKNNLMIPYGVSDFKVIRNEGLYYVDKTEFLAKLESRDRFVFFVRPRRFGKSLFISMMQCYYDRREKENFEKYFGGLWLGSNPTANRNRYMVLMLDFSKVDGTGGNSLEEKFANYMDAALDNFVNRYADEFPAGTFDRLNRETKYQTITDAAKNAKLPLYLIIDEYDNFTNSLIRSSGNEPYRSITHKTGFYRAWFKIFKGSFDRIFMTGVSPVTMDDLTSGFNIASNISQDEDFNAMLGFSEVETLQIYRDFKGTGKYVDGDPERIVAGIKPWYDGYCFAKETIGKESVFNSDMVLYHLKHLVAKGRPPENMVDVNIATDYDKLETIVDLQRLAGETNMPPSVAKLVEGVPFDIRESFDMDKIVKPELFPTILRNEGIITASKYHHGLVNYSFPNIAAGVTYLHLINGWRSSTDSYIVELKYSKPDASDADLAAKAADGIEKLRRYASDRFVPELVARGTRLHLILFQFKGTDLVRLEEIPL